jgi:hypothetical protein
MKAERERCFEIGRNVGLPNAQVNRPQKAANGGQDE